MASYVTNSKGAPLNRDQKKTLVELIMERPVIQDKTQGMEVYYDKAKAWNEVTEAFNQMYPMAEKKSEKQLKRVWEYLKKTVTMCGSSPSLKSQSAMASYTTNSKGAPLNHDQKKTLMELVMERPIIQDKSHGISVCNEKAKAWNEVTEAFNQVYPTAEKKSEKQLKRAWEYLKKIMQKQQTDEKPCPTTKGIDPSSHLNGVLINPAASSSVKAIGKCPVDTFTPSSISASEPLENKRCREGEEEKGKSVVREEGAEVDRLEFSDPLQVDENPSYTVQERNGCTQNWRQQTKLLATKGNQKGGLISTNHSSHPDQVDLISTRGIKPVSERDPTLAFCQHNSASQGTKKPHHHQSESKGKNNCATKKEHQDHEQEAGPVLSVTETEEDPLSLDSVIDTAHHNQSLTQIATTRKIRRTSMSKCGPIRNHSSITKNGEADIFHSKPKDTPCQRTQAIQKEENEAPSAEKRVSHFKMNEVYNAAVEYISMRNFKQSEYDRVMHERQLRYLDEFHQQQMSLLKEQAEIFKLQKEFWEGKIAEEMDEK